jgi:Cu/Ag efflux protein CusF
MQFKPHFAVAVFLLSVASLCANAYAQAPMDHSAMGHGSPVSPAKVAATPMTEGQVKKVDIKAQTVTLAHGPIKNLDMPAMTMVFKVSPPTLLATVKVGDKVKFSAEMPNGVMTVVALEKKP